MISTQGALKGNEKAAIFLISLGSDKAAKVFKHLKEEEIEQITLEIANFRTVDSDTKEAVMDEFYQICLAKNYISEGGIEYAKEVLDKAIGTQKTLEIISKLTSTLQVKPFDFVRRADPAHLFNFIQNEHPQTIALVLSYMDTEQASMALSALPMEKQVQVAYRIATMERTSPEYIKEVERVLENKMSTLSVTDYTTIGGIQTTVDILNSVDRATEKNILEQLSEMDSELTEEIRKRMFVFEDIVNLDSRSIQRVINEIDMNDLILALKGTTDQVANTIFANMSKRLQETIKEDMEFLGPVKLKDVEKAQQRIVATIRNLEDTGQIILVRGKGDELIV